MDKSKAAAEKEHVTSCSGYRPFLESTRLYLREVRLSDVTEIYYRWMNDPEVIQCLQTRFYPNSIEGLRAYVDEKLNDRSNVFLAILLKDGERHIGNIKLGPIDWIHRRADIGIMIGEKDCWGKGYATEAIRLVADYAFSVLNLHKLTAGCEEHCRGSAKAFQKAGFVVEGLRRQQYYSRGLYADEILMGLVRPEGEGNGTENPRGA
jgi:RimJ/RimL family protein N-acetyltransferase